VVFPLLARHCKGLVPLLAVPAALLLSQGQAKALLIYNAILAPEVSGAMGSGTAVLSIDEVANLMNIEVDFLGLSGNSTIAHIHGPAAVPLIGTASVITTTPSFANFPNGVKSGTYSNILDLLASTTYRAGFITANGNTITGARDAFLTALNGQKAYFNVHSTTFTGGEIRGFFQKQQVPAPLPVLGAGAAMAWSRKLRKRIGAAGITPPQA